MGRIDFAFEIQRKWRAVGAAVVNRLQKDSGWPAPFKALLGLSLALALELKGYRSLGFVRPRRSVLAGPPLLKLLGEG